MSGRRVYAALRTQDEVFKKGKAPAAWGLPPDFKLEGWCIDRETLTEIRSEGCADVMFIAKDTNQVYVCARDDFYDPLKSADKSEHDGVSGRKGGVGTAQIILPIINPLTGEGNYKIRPGKPFKVR